MRYRIVRVSPEGERTPVARAGTFAEPVQATELCQELNDLAHRYGLLYEYAVETVAVVPAHRL